MTLHRGPLKIIQRGKEPVSVRYRFSVLTGLLSLLLVASGVLPQLLLSVPSQGMHLAATATLLVLFAGVLISAAVAVSPIRRTRHIAMAMAVPVIILQVLAFLLPNRLFAGLLCLSAAVFLGFIIVMIVRHIFSTRNVRGELIYASLCAYLLLGVLWAFLYSLIDVIQAGSFQHPHEPALHPRLGIGAEDFGMVLYFSFITLSTLGYGDITPVTPVARTLAAVEAVAGQLYLAVIVARLVGLHTAVNIERMEHPGADDSAPEEGEVKSSLSEPPVE